MNRDDPERMYAYWLCLVPGIGNRTVDRLKKTCGSLREVYGGGEGLWKSLLTPRQLEAMAQAKKTLDPKRAYEELQRTGIRFLLLEDADYPKRLREIPDPPFALFGKGMIPRDDVLSVAVVGARDCSEYGRFVASEFGRVLGSRKVQLVSGMARGIDGISQWAALEAGGVSFGVLGSGVDVCYPRENRRLYDRLCEQGGVLSAYPPGTGAHARNFPPRNRIVSGLADALVIVEARGKSGTLITVDMALEQGKEVYAVPGRVTDRLSDGCNWLLRQGAGVFLTPEDFLLEAEHLWQEKKRGEIPGKSAPEKTVMDRPLPQPLDPELQEVYQALDLEPRSLEEIREKIKGDISAPQLMAALMRLCLEGLAMQVTPGCFVCRA